MGYIFFALYLLIVDKRFLLVDPSALLNDLNEEIKDIKRWLGAVIIFLIFILL